MAEDYKPQPGTGSVFKNDRKQEEWHADWNGKILLPDGTEHYIDVYDNVSKSGQEYRRVRIGRPVANQGGQAPVQNTQSANTAPAQNIQSLDDDLPF